MEATEIYLEHAGTRLFAVESGSGRPIVLVHGGLANHQGIRLWATPLAERFRLVTPDLRAHGRSPFGGALSWDLFADDIAALLRHLDIPRAVIGGISFGTGCAVRVALRYPELVEELVLLHPVYRGSDLGLLPAQDEAMQAMHSFGRRAPSEGIEVMLPLFDRAPEAIRARAKALIATYDPASVATSTAFMASGAQPFDAPTQLASITAPTLIVPGIDPQHPPDVAALYAGHLPRATVRETADFAAAIAELLS